VSWKYGTVLDGDNGRCMIVREIPIEQAGEKELYEAITLDEGNWIAVSPRDGDLTEISEDDFAVVWGSSGIHTVIGGKWYNATKDALTSSGVDLDSETIKVSFKADGTFDII
jgi:hypothetical protein